MYFAVVKKRKALLCVISVIMALLVVSSHFLGGFTAVFAVKRKLPIYRVKTENKVLSISFDCAWGVDYTQKLLDIMEREGGKCTFFAVEFWVKKHPEFVKKIVESGHEIANHGYFHKDHKKLSLEQNEQEISLTGAIIEALCGVKPTLFAPPSGSFSDLTLEACYRLNYKVIMWSKDTIDWRDSDLSVIYNRATKNPENGDLILMHPKAHTLKALSRIIEFYRDLGFEIVAVSDNIL